MREQPWGPPFSAQQSACVEEALDPRWGSAVWGEGGKSVVFGVRTYMDSQPSFIIHGQIYFLSLSALVCQTRVVLWPVPVDVGITGSIAEPLVGAVSSSFHYCHHVLLGRAWILFQGRCQHLPPQGQSEGSFVPVPALCAGGGCMEG